MRTYTAYCQRDPRWGSIKLGASNVTIAEDGCYITSFSIVATYYGHNITPDQLNQIFIQKGLYVNNDYVSNDNDLQNVFPDIVYQGTDHYETIPADLGKLQSYMSDETISVILEVDLGGGNVHFVVCQACDGQTVTIVNPYDGAVENFTQDYGDPAKNILKFVVYKGTVLQQTTQPDYEQLFNEKRIECDLNWNCFTEVCAKLGVIVDPNNKQGTADQAVEKIQGYLDGIATLEGQVSTLGTTNTNLKTNISQVQKDNKDLLTKMADMQENDSTAIDEGVKAENDLKEATQEIQTIAGAVGAKDTSTTAILTEISNMKDTIDQQQKAQEKTVNQAWTFIQTFFTELSKKKKV